MYYLTLLNNICVLKEKIIGELSYRYLKIVQEKDNVKIQIHNF
jgi:hypothetical protein